MGSGVSKKDKGRGSLKDASSETPRNESFTQKRDLTPIPSNLLEVIIDIAKVLDHDVYCLSSYFFSSLIAPL